MIRWEKSFETNVGKVDEQHKYLIQLINDLNDQVLAQLDFDNYDRIIEILTALKNYTMEHFEHEEFLMKDHMEQLQGEELAIFWDYFKEHRQAHRQFVVKIEELMSKDVDALQAEISVDLINYLVDWLKNHILRIDLQLPRYLIPRD